MKLILIFNFQTSMYLGRMPMAELADAIVQCGRSTLEWTISHIEKHPKWNAEVVYGDTDSVFVYLKGRTKEQAFEIGNEIALDITRMSPKTVVLKLEKVYLPCILVSKKRYVGYSFESLNQAEGHLDAKGIEMVRRDQCLATTKIQEKCLRILFRSKDLSEVKNYLVCQLSKIFEGLDKVPLKEFIFSKEVRLGHYAIGHNGAAKSLPPGAIVSHKAMLYDPMMKPPFRWRVAYVVCSSDPKSQLKDMVMSPDEVIASGGVFRINHIYYITKCILPSLNRLFVLAGVDVESWFRQMPKPALRIMKQQGIFDRKSLGVTSVGGMKQTAITNYMHLARCELCGRETKSRICSVCMDTPEAVYTLMMRRLDNSVTKSRSILATCKHCCKHNQYFISWEPISATNQYNEITKVERTENCQSLDCPVLYQRIHEKYLFSDIRMILSDVETFIASSFDNKKT